MKRDMVWATGVILIVMGSVAGATTYGGRWVVNPSGGLLSKGHPIGATGLAQCAELSWQLRGEAGELVAIDQAAAESDLLRAGDLEALAVLHRGDEIAGIEQ